MATYEELFGSKGIATGGKSSRWLSWKQEGEEILVQLTGEPDQRDQVIGKENKKKWLVRMVAGGRVSPMAEGDFDPEKVDGAWLPPEKDVVIPVRAVGRKDAGGKKLDDFEPFDTEWELSKGDFLDKIKEEMLKTGHALAPGALIALKLLDNHSQRRHQFSVKFVKPAE